MGFEDEVEQSLGRPCRQVTVGPSGPTNSPHPSSREGHHSTVGGARVSFGSALPSSDGRSKRTYELTSSIVPRGTPFYRGWSSSFLLSDVILHGFHAAAAACSRVQRNSVPSTQMRCMITANLRASATIAFFIPRRLAICIAQALSQDHFFDHIML